MSSRARLEKAIVHCRAPARQPAEGTGGRFKGPGDRILGGVAPHPDLRESWPRLCRRVSDKPCLSSGSDMQPHASAVAATACKRSRWIAAGGCRVREPWGAAPCIYGPCSWAVSDACLCPVPDDAVLAWMSASALTRLAVPRKLSTMVLRFQAISTCRVFREL